MQCSKKLERKFDVNLGKWFIEAAAQRVLILTRKHGPLKFTRLNATITLRGTWVRSWVLRQS